VVLSCDRNGPGPLGVPPRRACSTSTRRWPRRWSTFGRSLRTSRKPRRCLSTHLMVRSAGKAPRSAKGCARGRVPTVGQAPDAPSSRARWGARPHGGCDREPRPIGGQEQRPRRRRSSTNARDDANERQFCESRASGCLTMPASVAGPHACRAWSGNAWSCQRRSETRALSRETDTCGLRPARSAGGLSRPNRGARSDLTWGRGAGIETLCESGRDVVRGRVGLRFRPYFRN
jgi:hypothetical protein